MDNTNECYDDAYIVAFSNLGMLIGSAISGKVSHKYGRRRTIILILLAKTILSILSAT